MDDPALATANPPATSAPSPSPAKKPKGGFRPGAGLKKGTQLRTKRTYHPEALVETLVDRFASTGSMQLKAAPQIGHVTDEDRRMIQRVTGLSAEQINARIIEKMAAIADATADRVLEKLAADEFRPGELGFILSVAIDKRQALDGSRALASANVHNQILVVGDKSRDELMDLLEGRKRLIPPQTERNLVQAEPELPIKLEPAPNAPGSPAQAAQDAREQV